MVSISPVTTGPLLCSIQTKNSLEEQWNSLRWLVGSHCIELMKSIDLISNQYSCLSSVTCVNVALYNYRLIVSAAL